ncbi:hypothetical protein CMV_016698 [Castanea mollissima]|uniref:Uncharacterized protein n=1 Tax=Castanea mollissima TaxID=60419 RepID=A0A8J4QTM3_9ROSI|nr:hypothetical protein CMV_016698 [Castanea mollissima]
MWPKPLRSETHKPQLTLSSKETIFGTWTGVYVVHLSGLSCSSIRLGCSVDVNGGDRCTKSPSWRNHMWFFAAETAGNMGRGWGK